MGIIILEILYSHNEKWILFQSLLQQQQLGASGDKYNSYLFSFICYFLNFSLEIHAKNIIVPSITEALFIYVLTYAVR